MPKKHFMNLFFSYYTGNIVNHGFVLMVFLKTKQYTWKLTKPFYKLLLAAVNSLVGIIKCTGVF